MITIDGSQGEGGGQVLRTGLALSILTGQAIEIEKIRHNRSEPGLKAQHLQAVKAAGSICRAELEGAYLGSSRIAFVPAEVRSGRYAFEIGTAGATTLVLQTIFLPLSRAGSASTVRITGGTHVARSPDFHFLKWHWLPALEAAGFDGTLSLDRAGFYPRGDGQITATIRPVRKISPIHLAKRGRLLRIRGLSAVANLDKSIADRQKRQALRRLSGQAPEVKIQTAELSSLSKGTAIVLLAEFEGGRACYRSLGKLGKPAEAVADEAVDALLAFIESGAAVDEHLADQLVLPLALASGPSTVSTCAITLHLLTQVALVQRFLPVKIEIDGDLDRPGTVHITPR